MLVAGVATVGSLADNAGVGRIGLAAGKAAFAPRVKAQAFQKLTAAADNGTIAAEVVFDPVAFFGAAAFTFDNFTDDFAVGAQVLLVLDFTVFAGLFLVEQTTAFARVEVALGAGLAGDLFDTLVFAVVPVFFTLATTGRGPGQVVTGPAGGIVTAL